MLTCAAHTETSCLSAWSGPWTGLWTRPKVCVDWLKCESIHRAAPGYWIKIKNTEKQTSLLLLLYSGPGGSHIERSCDHSGHQLWPWWKDYGAHSFDVSTAVIVCSCWRRRSVLLCRRWTGQLQIRNTDRNSNQRLLFPRYDILHAPSLRPRLHSWTLWKHAIGSPHSKRNVVVILCVSEVSKRSIGKNECEEF